MSEMSLPSMPVLCSITIIVFFANNSISKLNDSDVLFCTYCCRCYGFEILGTTKYKQFRHPCIFYNFASAKETSDPD